MHFLYYLYHERSLPFTLAESEVSLKRNGQHLYQLARKAPEGKIGTLQKRYKTLIILLVPYNISLTPICKVLEGLLVPFTAFVRCLPEPYKRTS